MSLHHSDLKRNAAPRKYGGKLRAPEPIEISLPSWPLELLQGTGRGNYNDQVVTHRSHQVEELITTPVPKQLCPCWSN